MTSSSSLYLFHSHNAVNMRQKNIKTFGMTKDMIMIAFYTTLQLSKYCDMGYSRLASPI